LIQDWQKFSVPPTASVRDTMRVIGQGLMQIALVVDESRRLLGTVTDGDIRRGLLNGQSLDSPIRAVMNPQPIVVSKKTSTATAIRLMREKKIRQLITTDPEGRVVGIQLLDAVLSSLQRDNPVVIMAGGRGSRLRPLTEDTPKPMLAVGDRPLLETIVSRFANEGFEKLFVSLGYKGDAIQSHFKDGKDFGVQISYLTEDREMGTAGALGLLPERPSAPLIVMNCDVLTNVSFAKLLEFHEERGSIATMAVRQYDFKVPYGVVQTREGRITSIDEKPTLNFFVNAGIYVLNPAVLELIPRGQRFDMTQLFDQIVASGKPSSAFPICEYWTDIGSIDDFERAKHEYTGHFSQ
jgi:dTDP-glucose pyrophosphorylase